MRGAWPPSPSSGESASGGRAPHQRWRVRDSRLARSDGDYEGSGEAGKRGRRGETRGASPQDTGKESEVTSECRAKGAGKAERGRDGVRWG